MPSDADYQALIKSELDVAGSPFEADFNTNIVLWWGLYSSYGTSYGTIVQYLFAKRRAVIFLIGKARGYIDLTIGFDQIKGSQVVGNLVALLKALQLEIDDAVNGIGVPTLESVQSVSQLYDPELDLMAVAQGQPISQTSVLNQSGSVIVNRP